MIAGKPKDGKTAFVTSLCAALVQGTPFGGLRTSKCRVFYFAAEETVMEWRWSVRPYLPELDPNEFMVAHGGFPLDDEMNLAALRYEVRRMQIDVVVVDPLTAALNSSDLTNAARARKVIAGLKSICEELNVNVIVIHHAREKRGRASRVAENPQLAAAASLNLIFNWHRHAEGRIVTLDLKGRGRFAVGTRRFLSRSLGHYEFLPNLKDPMQRMELVK